MTYDLRCIDLGKKYRVSRPGATRRWTDVFHNPPMDDFWALRGVSFDAAPGDVLGIIGPNGAGKSTLLKLLSSITAPSEGEIRIRGRLAALIEVGSGFHPELTGRENVFLSGTILGLRRREIAARLESIVEFAGIGAFLDVPVKWYSSGMYVRLGFAVAAQLEPDVLLVDEVLAVGDAAFQAKCLERIMDLRRRGTTIIFISHDLGTVERLCDRAILLQAGRVQADGTAREVVSTYLRGVAADLVRPRGEHHDDALLPRIDRLSITSAGGGEMLVARSGEAVSFDLGISVPEATRAAVSVFVYSFDDGTLLCECGTDSEGVALDPGESIVRFTVPSLTLLAGRYTLGATIRRVEAARPDDWWFGRTTLHVETGPALKGQFHLPYACSVVRAVSNEQ
jgi:lipopolysaccharide transport system ATP-binding protein